MKICNKCKQNKNLKEFNIDNSRTDGYAYVCKLCKKQYSITYYEKNKTSIKTKSAEYYLKNPTDHIKRNKMWVNKNRQKLNEYQNKYYKLNADKIKKYKKNKVKSIQEKLIHNLRIRLKDILFKNKINKNNNTIKYLGCSHQEYKQYLEQQFKPEMTWENHGKIWEIDHIIPLSIFDLTQEENIYIAFNYKNTQPLFKTTKIAKNFKYINEIGNRNKYNKHG